MKKIQIYVKGNYLVVVDTQKNEYFYGIRKEVHVDKSNANTPSYRIFNVKDFKKDTVITIPNILKEDGTAYSEAEFDTFYQENTGNFNGGGSAPTQSNIIEVTRVEAEALQISSSFVVGATYVITDADVNLYGGTEITLTAITSNQLSLQGSGLFYCPKYDVSAESTGYGIWTTYMEGTFSNIVGGFSPGEMITDQNGAEAIYLAEGFLNYVSGDWSLAVNVFGASGAADVSGFVSPSYTIGQIAHWGGKSWTNNNGNIGASIDKYTLDAEWTEIPFNETDYNVYVDEIQYDFGNDMIIYRKDRYNNIVSGSHQVFVEFESLYGNPIKDFQWGCMQDDFNTNDYGIQGNEVIDSYFETLNTRGKYIWFNQLSKTSFITNNIFATNCFLNSSTFSFFSGLMNNIFAGLSRIDSINLYNESLISESIFSLNTYLRSINMYSSYLYFIEGEVKQKAIFNKNIYDSELNISINANLFFTIQATTTIFRRQDLTPRLQYVNNSDVIVITDVDA